MIRQSKAKIFLADERGLNQTKWFRSHNTFNFGKFQNDNKQPFGGIYLLNDDMLAGGKSLNMFVEEDSYVILLPIAGAINCKTRNENKTLFTAGQIMVYTASAGEKIEITNPFKKDAVNFLQIWIKASEHTSKLDRNPLTYDDVNENLNKLINIFPANNDLPFSISIGKFSGRCEIVYKLSGNAGCFLFILAGAFETEGRLLHERDGLAVWDTDEIEIEALSNDAIMLLIETSL